MRRADRTDAWRAAGRDDALPGHGQGRRLGNQHGTEDLRTHGLAPRRLRTFKLGRDPQFASEIRDVVGLYVDPPAHAVVLSVDEKSQIQALDRTQPGLPMKKGRAGTTTHDYVRNGTTTLFAAMNVLDGTVIGQCMQRHRHQEFIRFLNRLERDIPAGKLVHVVLDNYGSHKHPEVRACSRHPRWTFHFTPTSASWLNAVEGFLPTLQPPPRARRVPFAGRPPGRDQPVPRRAQPKPQALRLDRRPGRLHRRRKSRVPSVRFDPLARFVIYPTQNEAIGARIKGESRFAFDFIWHRLVAIYYKRPASTSADTSSGAAYGTPSDEARAGQLYYGQGVGSSHNRLQVFWKPLSNNTTNRGCAFAAPVRAVIHGLKGSAPLLLTLLATGWGSSLLSARSACEHNPAVVEAVDWSTSTPVEIRITHEGFEPHQVELRRDQPAVLRVAT